MVDFSDDADTFLADFGKAVVCGAVSGVGVLDMPGQIIGDGIAISDDYQLTVRADLFEDVNFGDTLTHDGTSYRVKHFRKLDDGVLGVVALEKP